MEKLKIRLSEEIFIAGKREISIIIPLVKNFLKFFDLFSPLRWIRCFSNFFFNTNWGHHKLPFLLTDLYVLAFIILLAVTFVFGSSLGFPFLLIILIPILRLIDILKNSFRLMLVHREDNWDEYGYYIETRHSTRWIIINFINVFGILLSFAILYLAFGSQFDPQITDHITAFYQSTIVLTTLGYGKTYPLSSLTKGLIIFQLGYFLVFFIMVLPRVISSIRTKELFAGEEKKIRIDVFNKKLQHLYHNISSWTPEKENLKTIVNGLKLTVKLSLNLAELTYYFDRKLQDKPDIKKIIQKNVSEVTTLLNQLNRNINMLNSMNSEG